MMKPHTNDVIRRLDFVPEPSFDSNKNYTKNPNKIINGLKTSKKLSLDEASDTSKTRKSWRTRVRNGMIVKSKQNRNLRSSKRVAGLTLNMINEEEDDPIDSFDKINSQNDEQDYDHDNMAVENIAERIKRRKEKMEKETSNQKIEPNTSKRSRAVRKKTLSEGRDESPVTDHVSTCEKNAEADIEYSEPRRTKRRKINRTSQNDIEDREKNESSSDMSGKASLRKSTRNLTKVSKSSDHVSDGVRNKNNNKFNYESPPESSDETEECVPNNNHVVGTCVNELPSDKEAIEEQQRIERLLLQEQEDFELARRLQAQFDEMERIAGRPRRTRKATEGERSIETDVTGTVCKTNGKRKSTVSRAVNTTVKRKRGRPSKCVKIAANTREDETRAR